MRYNPFDRAVPGQSLTNEPGNYSWEHPPQYVELDKASLFLWDKLHDDVLLDQLIMMLDSQVPVEALVRVILFNGFVEGKWTPDLAVMLVPILMQQIVAIGKKAGVRNIRILIGDNTGSSFKRSQFNLKYKEKNAKAESPEAKQKELVERLRADIEKEKSKGLMGKKETEMEDKD